MLYGKVNPSARLPLTMPNKENETAFTPAQWPGLPDPSNPTYANYTEGLHVGYRYYDAHKIPFTTGFPFGMLQPLQPASSTPHACSSELTLKLTLNLTAWHRQDTA